MGKTRRGGYIFISWIGGHPPRHIHVYKNGRLVTKFDLESWRPMTGEVNKEILKYLFELNKKGKL